MINVTVPVPESRVKEFYSRFADFLSSPASTLDDGEAGLHSLRTAPQWVTEPGATERATSFWHEVTDTGRDLLRVLIDGAPTNRQFTPEELASETNAKSTQSVAGTFGGIGQLIVAQGLPRYQYAPGKSWHFIWDWDPKKRLYSMSPEMAALLQEVGA